MSWYCEVARGHPVHGPYHDREYGFPLRGEAALFERLSLEVFQAGLSWLLVLNKRAALARAFAGFDVDRVAGYGEADLERLLQDATIIRNRRKLRAVVDNAWAVQTLRGRCGGFASWLDGQHPQDLDGWLASFRATFKFMGAEVVREFLLSTGYLAGAHQKDCPAYRQVLERQPAWLISPG